ncbi:MAG TPA: hypothetical protein DD417_18855 [Elusimicrobia bacterium]|nr:hypothetical protein [Elusimicrobiota bacterium]
MVHLPLDDVLDQPAAGGHAVIQADLHPRLPAALDGQEARLDVADGHDLGGPHVEPVLAQDVAGEGDHVDAVADAHLQVLLQHAEHVARRPQAVLVGFDAQEAGLVREGDEAVAVVGGLEVHRDAADAGLPVGEDEAGAYEHGSETQGGFAVALGRGPLAASGKQEGRGEQEG